MSKSNSLETSLLALYFNATAIADIAQDDGSSPATALFVGLHSADPGEAGTQATNEISTAQHGGYARVSVARTAGGWTVSGNSVTNAAAITFPTGTAGAGTIATHFSIGPTASGASVLAYSGELIGPRVVVTADATLETLNATSHGFTAGQAIFVRVTDGVLPGGLSAATTYFVITANANDFQVSLTQGGSAVNITSTGNGTITAHLNKNIPVGLNTIPTIATSQLTVTED